MSENIRKIDSFIPDAEHEIVSKPCLNSFILVKTSFQCQVSSKRNVSADIIFVEIKGR